MRVRGRWIALLALIIIAAWAYKESYHAPAKVTVPTDMVLMDQRSIIK